MLGCSHINTNINIISISLKSFLVRSASAVADCCVVGQVALEVCPRLPGPRYLVACREPSCGAANLSGFRFCQQCGVARKCVPVKEGSAVAPDDEAIAARRSRVLAVFDMKSHERKKAKELDAFTVFLTLECVLPMICSLKTF